MGSQIFARLDEYTSQLRRDHPEIDSLSPLAKTTLVAEYLLRRRWVGISDGRDYHSLDHLFLGVALYSENRNSLPLISVLIYCNILRRFGLRAVPCSFPFHVHAIVRPPVGFRFDGQRLIPPSSTPASDTATGNGDSHSARFGAAAAEALGSAASSPSTIVHTTPTANAGATLDDEDELLFMDPFNTSTPIPLADLKEQLAFISAHFRPDQNASFLTASPVAEIAVRAAHNILNAPNHSPQSPLFPINENLCPYAANWALALLPTSLPAREQSVALLVQEFVERFDFDIRLVEGYILPHTGSYRDGVAFRRVCREIRRQDNAAKVPKRRGTKSGEGETLPTTATGAAGGDSNVREQGITANSGASADSNPNARVQYRIGQVFRHRRRNYLAVITGWDDCCRMEEGWILMNQVDRLTRGRYQPFYNVM